MSTALDTTQRIQRSVQTYADEFLEAVRKRRWLKMGLFVGPSMAILVLFLVLPISYMFLISLSDAFPLGNLTLENYLKLIQTESYVRVIWRTSVLTIQTTILVVLFAYAIAYGMAMFAKRANLVLFFIILPFWVNYLVRNFSLLVIFLDGGAIHQLLRLVPVIELQPQLLFTRTAVLAGLVYSFLPVAILPMYASIARMDKSLIMAAKDLGADPIRTFLYVTLPNTKDGILVAILLSMIPTFGAFVTPAMLGGPNDRMIGQLIEYQFMRIYDVPFGSSLGVLTATFVFLVLVVSTRLGGIPLIEDDDE
jgi:spermidine/putrescine transport system permease protein